MCEVSNLSKGYSPLCVLVVTEKPSRQKVNRASEWTIVQKPMVMHQESTISELEVILNPDF